MFITFFPSSPTANPSNGSPQLLSRKHTRAPITVHNPIGNDVTSTCLEALIGAPLAVRVKLCIFTERLVVDVYVGAHLVTENLHDVYVFFSNGLLRVHSVSPDIFTFSQGPTCCSAKVTFISTYHEQRLLL